MIRMSAIGLFFGCLATAPAQESTDLNALDRRLDMVAATRKLQKYTGAAGARINPEISKTVEEGIALTASGNTSEARRRIYRAYALIDGKEWTPLVEFGSALVLRTDMRVMDPARRPIVRLEQIYPARYSPRESLRLRVAIHEGVRKSTAMTPGKLLRDLGVFDVISRDLIDEPFLFDVDLAGLPDGPKVLAAELADGATSVKKLFTSIQLVAGLDARAADTERRLRKLDGHASAGLTVRAPFELARSINLGRREFTEIGFADELRQSAELLSALESGRDPLLRALGDHKRHYEFADAGTIMPYRVYAPKSYKPGAHLPLVVMLHGWGGTEDTLMNTGDHLAQKLAEQHGFVLVAPLGYRPNGGYGVAVGGAKDPSSQRAYAMSEQDVLNVVKLVGEEYSTDGNRTFLLGHSMGGGGTWHLAQKYPRMWAGIAPIAAGVQFPESYPYERLKGLAVMVSHGEADTTAPVSYGRRMVAGLKKAGYSPVYLEEPGATHGSIVAIALPQIFDFFARQTRTEPASGF